MNGYRPGYILTTVTLEQIKAAKPAKIYYGVNTCWWTHRPEDLCRHPETGLPCDPRGGMLMETSGVNGFLLEAERDTSRYGKFGLRAFIAAHHGNCVVSPDDRRSTCFASWREYQDAIMRTDAFNQEVASRVKQGRAEFLNDGGDDGE